MKTFTKLAITLIVFLNLQFANAQNSDYKGFELTGKNPETIQLNQTFTQDAEVYSFTDKISSIYGLAVKADISFSDENGVVRIILIDQQYNEYLVYEAYPMLEENISFSIENLSEETGALNKLKPQLLKIEVKAASLSIRSITYTTAADNNIDIQKVAKEKKNLQNSRKINQINKSINAKGMAWVAGETEVSALSYREKKKLYGQSTFPSGIEYYVGGVMQIGNRVTLKSGEINGIVENWDWRNRHGKNWITSVKNQGSCGSCWAFATTGATEAQVNLFYNQPLNMDLSEQNILSCSGAGNCSGGYPSIALDYIKNTGIIDESAFSYTATNQVCTNQSSNPAEQFKIGGRLDFGSTDYPVSEDNLKKMIIKYGPVSGGLLSMSHAMTLVGWKVVKEGDRFLYLDINKIYQWSSIPAGSTLIGKTVWLFKNSWGGSWGDGGYFYVETDITNFAWTHALTSPMQSLKQNYTIQCVDNDHDGYYWWGLGAKPAGAPACPNTPDGNDADATLGPLDSYGNCISLNSVPVADFTTDKITIYENGSASFTDLSTNAPTAWSWTFDGGTPSSSTLKNPVVNYKTSGKYDVTLVVTNANGNSTKIRTEYITVNANISTYASSNGNASKEWISKVSMNGTTLITNSSGTTGYADLTANVFNLATNSTGNMSLTPKYSGKINYWCWSVWIDLNHDFDFNDAGEQVLTTSKSKTAVTKSIIIPSGTLTGATRMRISMKRDVLPLSNEVFAYGEVKDFTVNISAPTASESQFISEVTENTSIKPDENNIAIPPASTVKCKSASIEEPSVTPILSLTVFPNPTESQINLRLDKIFGNEVYSIYNMQGEMIKTEKVESNLTQVNVASLSAGIYLVTVKNGEQIVHERFIKR